MDNPTLVALALGAVAFVAILAMPGRNRPSPLASAPQGPPEFGDIPELLRAVVELEKRREVFSTERRIRNLSNRLAAMAVGMDPPDEEPEPPSKSASKPARKPRAPRKPKADS